MNKMRIELDNMVKDPVDERDLIAGFSSDRESNYGMIDFVREIEDQGVIGSCVGQTGVSAMELQTYIAGVRHNFSRLFAYYNVRLMDGRIGQEGAYLRSIMKSIAKYGLPEEDQYPYIESKQNDEPSAEIYKAAEKFKVTKYERVDLVREKIAGAIDADYPIAFAMEIFSDFYSMPGQMDASYYKGEGQSAGGHAMVIIGYDNDGVILENSWSSLWGDRGMCMISWDILYRDGYDAWVATEYEDNTNVAPVDPEPQPEPTPVDPEPTPEPKDNKSIIDKIFDMIKSIFDALFGIFKH